MDDGHLNEFPVNSREVCDFERSLTALYCGSVCARERRPKNTVQSITLCKEKLGVGHEYLMIKVKNHNDDDSTHLRLHRTANNTDSPTSPLSPHSAGEDGHEVAATSRRPSASLRSSSATSIRKSVVCFGTEARDFIEVFEDYGDDKVCGRIDFEHDNFTLYALVLIAKVVHEAREIYQIQKANCFWYAAMVSKVAMGAYDGAEDPDIIPCGGTFLWVPWGAHIKSKDLDEVLRTFKELEKEKEAQIRKAVDRETALMQIQAESQKRSESQRETAQAKERAERAIHEAEEAKRETKARDAEIIELKRLVAQNGIRRPIERI